MSIKPTVSTCIVLFAMWASQTKLCGEDTKLKSDGFIRDWLLLAPIQLESDSNGADAIEKNQIPDEGHLKPKAGDKVTVAGKEFVWKKAKATDYYLDLNAAVNQQTEKTIGYAVCYINCETERTNLELKMGSNDEGKVFLNGKLLLKTSEPRALEQDDDVAHNITLNKGVNTIVFKIFNEGGSDWQGCLRFTDKVGHVVTNLAVQLEP